MWLLLQSHLNVAYYCFHIHWKYYSMNQYIDQQEMDWQEFSLASSSLMWRRPVFICLVLDQSNERSMTACALEKWCRTCFTFIAPNQSITETITGCSLNAPVCLGMFGDNIKLWSDCKLSMQLQNVCQWFTDPPAEGAASGRCQHDEAFFQVTSRSSGFSFRSSSLLSFTSCWTRSQRSCKESDWLVGMWQIVTMVTCGDSSSLISCTVWSVFGGRTDLRWGGVRDHCWSPEATFTLLGPGSLRPPLSSCLAMKVISWRKLRYSCPLVSVPAEPPGYDLFYRCDEMKVVQTFDRY